MSEYYDTIVCSGGAVKTISTLGVLQYCYDQHLTNHVHTFIGTSAGAIIGYLLAIGYSPTELLVYICVNDLFNHTTVNITSMLTGNGAMSFTNLQDHLEKLTIDKVGYLLTFKELKDKLNKVLVTTTFNYTKRRIEYMSWETVPDMPCIVALKMSCCLPLVFEKFKYMDSYYIDGAIADNFPFTYTLTHTTTTNRLGILVDLLTSAPTSHDEENIINYVYNLISFSMLTNDTDTLVRNTQHDIIKVKNNVNALDFNISLKDKLELFSIGYKTGKEHFTSMKN
jgi:predicted acylesterase/phospholipase RssA